MSYYRSDDTGKKALISLAILVVSVLVVLAIVFSGGKMAKVVVYNTGFWIMLFISVVFGVVRKLTKPDDFSWGELPIQLGGSVLVIIGLYFLFFSTSTNLMDAEVWNGSVSRAEYYEEWTELEVYYDQVPDGKDSDGNTKYKSVRRTRHVYHGPEWKLVTSVGDVGVSKGVYRNYVGRFNNETKKDIFHADQVSIGDGDMFYVTARDMPASVEKPFVNYLRASASVQKVSGFISSYKSILRPYPAVSDNGYGRIDLYRVIDAGANAPRAWKDSLDKQLDLSLMSLGSVKQANVLVYLVGTPDLNAAYAIKENWVGGKKNDIIVVIGASKFPKMDFVHVLAWTDVELFKIELRDRILALKELNDGRALANVITGQMVKSPQSGGFKRLPMASMEYLIGDIKLPIWCQILIVLIGFGASFGISVILVKNEIL
jgi:hypothetical protein